MALACELAPLAFSDFFPPQAIPLAPCSPPADVPVLLSLPHAANAATDTTDTANANVFPRLLVNTRPLPWFVADFRTS
jgi:hypothetical protein